MTDHREGHVAGHSHEGDSSLDAAAAQVLRRGAEQLLEVTEGLEYRPLNSERYPLPITQALWPEPPLAERARSEVRRHLNDDPVAGLEACLALLELHVCNQPGGTDGLAEDGDFLGQAFATKRLNGWIGIVGDGDRGGLEEALAAQWKVRLLDGDPAGRGVYGLLNMLVRYGFVYGQIGPGDGHSMAHFLEEFGPGLLVCCGELEELDRSLVLAAMKLGVPAVVPPNFDFELGRQVRAGSVAEMVDALPAFRNMRKLLDLPDVPRLPEYLVSGDEAGAFELSATWGDTPESFYLLRKGVAESPGTTVTGEPGPALGIVVTVEGEPLDAFDCAHLETQAPGVLSQIPGVRARAEGGHLCLELSTEARQLPERIGEVLIANLRHQFPRLERIQVELIFDAEQVAAMAAEVRAEREDRDSAVVAATEEGVDEFIACIGCSPFAPDHVCVLTPERPPQCGRSYGMIKTGALYGWDDMSSIHHRAEHANTNSFVPCPKGELLDPAAGEWSGINETVNRLSRGRTARVQLHSLHEAPHTGCGCFQLVMFLMDGELPGIGIMERGYRGQAPDGRRWEDLHYALGGKQTPGMAGAPPAYLDSPRFLAAHGGWESVVWVSPRVAERMGERLPDQVQVGPSD